MSRLSFFGTHNAEETQPVILLHIEGECVSGAVALRGQQGVAPKILFSCEETFPLHRVGKDMNGAIILVLKKVIDRLQKDGFQHLTFTHMGSLNGEAVRDIYCTLASPWFLSQTKIVRESKAAPEVFSEKALEDLLQREAHAFCDAFATSEYGERFHEELELVESKVVSLSLNGYETARPKGQKLKEMEAALYFSIAGTELLKNIREVTSAVFHHAAVTFHTFPMVTFSVVRDVPTIPQHFLLVDVDGEVSDFTIVKKGVAMQTITVPLGAQHFIRTLQKSAGISPEVALSILGMHGMDSLSDETRAKVEPVLKKACKEWESSVSESISLLSEECFVPGTVIVAAEDRLQSFFSTLISDHSLGHGASDGTPFSVISLDREFLKKHYQIDAPAVHSINLLVTALFISKNR